MSESAVRVATRYLQAGQASPVPLSGGQKDFLKGLAASLNAVLRQHVDGSKPDYRAYTDYQSGKSYSKDGFGRKSPLAGTPHARLYLTITLAKDGQTLHGMPALEFLLAEDGQTAIVKDDTPWGRGNKSMTAQQIGESWANSIVFVLNREMQIRQRADRARQEKEQADALALREKEEAAAAKLRLEEEKRKRDEELRQRELLISGGGKGYTFATTTQSEDDELDADVDPWDGRQDPKSKFYEDSTTLATLRDVYRQLGSYDQVKLTGDKVHLSRSYDRKYNARGIYNLTRSYYEDVYISRKDGQAFNEAEQAYIKENILPKAN